MDPIPQGLRERKKLQTRKDLARAALRLFEERGYAATTIDDIAAAANVSRRTFFRYFKSKDEVLIVDPEGKLQAMHIALAKGPPEEPTLDALRRGALALTEAYWDPEFTLDVIRLMERERPRLASAYRASARDAVTLTRQAFEPAHLRYDGQAKPPERHETPQNPANIAPELAPVENNPTNTRTFDDYTPEEGQSYAEFLADLKKTDL